MTVEIVKGDIFEAFEKGEITYLVHQVNCLGLFGAGLAAEVKRRYPGVYKVYKEHIEREAPDSVLGDFLQVGKEGDYPVSRGIVNIFGQDGVGTHKRQTNYGAY
jgi:O-acetyl-ADP-ribose deacetylase (regulator of RNase III)